MGYTGQPGSLVTDDTTLFIILQGFPLCLKLQELPSDDEDLLLEGGVVVGHLHIILVLVTVLCRLLFSQNIKVLQALNLQSMYLSKKTKKGYL